jgi:pSer/pThr/pTyr-binding forkhead associated (FHA) protein
LVDLGNTDGTKVNGEQIQPWIVRPGDAIAMARTLLLSGSKEEIARRLGDPPGSHPPAGRHQPRQRSDTVSSH